ncbi:hypothetical protein DCO58_06150 [Helicobacter saguini]|uniref:Uncharacterized protein n=1 Tax=Helicobacter saguini TaxID=1548018 RepID=A0A6B0HIH4_9HELI|nr:hypothetical protein [Helicobacter saguini]MWV62078.1 hypothetical protein [Helicobacter saguini]MWV67249.1 hypothetical protein [Helicobacter saguini]MWV69602.1 hypothetical protein [Helicobacter saguini]MWV70848.1 hypothetical protein [Helicobacter saguini]
MDFEFSFSLPRCDRRFSLVSLAGKKENPNYTQNTRIYTLTNACLDSNVL